MKTVRVYDPPMCCSSGVCGPSVDPSLIRLAADLAWLKSKGVSVERFNLAHDPLAFMAEPLVAQALQSGQGLPMFFVGQEVVAQGSYPDRRKLAALLGLNPPVERTSLRVVG